MPLDAFRFGFAPLTPHVAAPVTGPAESAGDTVRCVTCDRPADTPFCPHCGERRAGDRPLRLRELADEVWGTFVAVDGRVVRSFWTLLRHPGALTAAYVRGERRRYLTPLGVFLSVNALFFVFATAHGFDGFTAPLANHLTYGSHRALARHLVNARLAERHTSMAAYASVFDAVAANQAKTLLLALVPLFAVWAACVQLPRRRPAVQHVVFALHALSVWLLALMASYYIAYAYVYGLKAAAVVRAWLAGGAPHGRYAFGDETLTPIEGVLMFAWLALAVRRVYGGGRVASALRAAGLIVSLPLLLSAYRLLVFFTAYWTT